MKIDLNADVGEGFEDDALFDVVTSVNIACGGHAGDEATMAAAIDAALRRELAIGAHPGYPDRANMGRVEIDISLSGVKEILLEQIETLARIADRMEAMLEHVKPHGALYNQAAVDPLLAMTIAEAVRESHPEMRLIGLARSALPAAGREHDLSVGEEGFADRRYRSDGSLAPRAGGNAMIEDPAEAAWQALALARGEPVGTIDGGTLTFKVDTICCHSDTPGSVEIARAVRRALERDGIEIAPL